MEDVFEGLVTWSNCVKVPVLGSIAPGLSTLGAYVNVAVIGQPPLLVGVPEQLPVLDFTQREPPPELLMVTALVAALVIVRVLQCATLEITG